MPSEADIALKAVRAPLAPAGTPSATTTTPAVTVIEYFAAMRGSQPLPRRIVVQTASPDFDPETYRHRMPPVLAWAARLRRAPRGQEPPPPAEQFDVTDHAALVAWFELQADPREREEFLGMFAFALSGLGLLIPEQRAILAEYGLADLVQRRELRNPSAGYRPAALPVSLATMVLRIVQLEGHSGREWRGRVSKLCHALASVWQSNRIQAEHGERPGALAMLSLARDCGTAHAGRMSAELRILERIGLIICRRRGFALERPGQPARRAPNVYGLGDGVLELGPTPLIAIPPSRRPERPSPPLVLDHGQTPAAADSDSGADRMVLNGVQTRVASAERPSQAQLLDPLTQMPCAFADYLAGADFDVVDSASKVALVVRAPLPSSGARQVRTAQPEPGTATSGRNKPRLRGRSLLGARERIDECKDLLERKAPTFAIDRGYLEARASEYRADLGRCARTERSAAQLKLHLVEQMLAEGVCRRYSYTRTGRLRAHALPNPLNTSRTPGKHGYDFWRALGTELHCVDLRCADPLFGAILAGDQTLYLDAIGKDLYAHGAAARAVTELLGPGHPLSADPTQLRTALKRLIIATFYGCGAATAARCVGGGQDRELGAALQRAVRKPYHIYTQWVAGTHRLAATRLETKRPLVLPNGFAVPIRRPAKHNHHRPPLPGIGAPAWRVQALVKVAVSDLLLFLEHEGYDPVFEVHDAVFTRRPVPVEVANACVWRLLAKVCRMWGIGWDMWPKSVIVTVEPALEG